MDISWGQPIALSVICFSVFLFADVAVLPSVADVYISTYGGGEGLNTFMKFDISSISPGSTIDSVFLSVFVYQVNPGWDGDVNFWNVNSQTWAETDLASSIWDIPTSDSINQPSGFGTEAGWTKSVDLKQIFLTDYNAGNTFCSIKMKDDDGQTFMVIPGSMPFDRDETLGVGNRAFGQHIYFYSHEYLGQQPPLLVVHYTAQGGIEEIAVRPAACALRSLGVYPTVFREKTCIKFQISNPKSQIPIRIYDATGRLIKDFSRFTNYDLRSTIIVWQGDDNLGRSVPAGVYFVQLEVGDYKRVEKAILLK